MKYKGTTILKVTGILMIIGGAVGFIFGLLAIAGASLLQAAVGSDLNLGLLLFASVLTVISSVVSLIAGILGVKNAARPDKAGLLIVFGVLTALFSVLGNVLTVMSGGAFSSTNLVLGLALPVVYLVGAYLNKQEVSVG